MNAERLEPAGTEKLSSAPHTPPPPPGFWSYVFRFERHKIHFWIAFRNTLGVVLPLIAGAAAGSVRAGLSASMGALNVSYSDGEDSYRQRARRMLAASVLVSVAAVAGILAGNSRPALALLTVAWAFAAGIMVALGTTAADIASMSLVTMVVFAGQPGDLETALLAGTLAFGGALLQTGLALTMWRARRYEPERLALATFYRALGAAAAEPPGAHDQPLASVESTAAQTALSSLTRDHSLEAERYLSLLNQAERARVNLMMLRRIRARIRREGGSGAPSAALERALDQASALFASIGACLESGCSVDREMQAIESMEAEAELLRAGESSDGSAAMVRDARAQLDALTGQLRSAAALSSATSPQGAELFSARETARPLRLRLGGSIATLRANLTFNSAAFRHAIRLALCLGLGEMLAGSLGLRRSYWLPMTIAIVLRPDFTATFSRGVLRLAGTLIGLLLMTGLYHFAEPALPAEIAMIAVAVFLMRYLGPANYGLFVITLSGLIVVLIAMTGVQPMQVIVARGLNTGVGGALALLSWIAWPTWERRHVSDAIAGMLEAYRRYFHIVRDVYIHSERPRARDLDRARNAARVARSNAEASIDRVSAEPGAGPERAAILGAILASSHRVAYAIMALEAGLSESSPAQPRKEFRTFSHSVELTLHSLAAALRGSPLDPKDLPDLREEHHQLVRAPHGESDRYTLVNLETDRLTNALNTLSERVFSWLASASQR